MYDPDTRPTEGEMTKAVVAEVVCKKQSDFNVIKVDEEQRIIFGWASVTKYQGEYVVDLQNEIIRTETLHKAVNEFMKSVRVGKVLHDGEQTGTIIHSFPISKEVCEALGIQSDKEGWLTGYYVEDDDLWEAVKSGDYREFSIGGNADKSEFYAD
jgi:hypothetical protein